MAVTLWSANSWAIANNIYVNTVAAVNNIHHEASNGTLTLSGSISGPGTLDMTFTRVDWNQTYNYTGDLTAFTDTLVIGKLNGTSNAYNYNFARPGAVQGSASAEFLFWQLWCSRPHAGCGITALAMRLSILAA